MGDAHLTAIGIGPAVGHGEQTSSRVATCELLVGKLRPVDGCAARAVTLQCRRRQHVV